MAALLSLTRPRDARLRYALCCAGLLLCVAMFAADVAHAYRALPAAGPADAASPLWSERGRCGAPWPGWAARRWPPCASGPAWRGCGACCAQPALDGRGLASPRRRPGAPHAPAARGGPASRAGLCTPMTAGWFKPVLLVPANLVTGMPPDLLEALLAHELAHVRRHDYLVNLLQFAAEILLFFHPGLVAVAAHPHRARTHRGRHGRRAYRSTAPVGACLERLEPGCRRRAAPVAPAARDGDLLDRIRRLARPTACRRAAP